MGCSVKVNQHGYLAYRLYWDGMESHEGTDLRDTPPNRKRIEARARTISDEIADGTFDYLHWFPAGNKAGLFRPTETPSPTAKLRVREYVEKTWLPRKQPPLVRASLAKTYRKHLRKHILPAFGRKTFDQITVTALESFRTELIDEERGKGLKLKTSRDIIDATFRALYRDARKEGLASGDPFGALGWPRKIESVPDPFTEAERDLLLDYFWRKDRHYFPLVYTHFWTGIRPGEGVGLRAGSLDITHSRLMITVSRTLGEDNPPKTKRSQRTITLIPEVVAVLREMPTTLHATDETFVFMSKARRPLDEERFVEKHWHRALQATGIRPRKFYATRHTFISVALARGVNIKWLADYCGTSVEMIERHYARWIRGDEGELTRLSGRTGKPETQEVRQVVMGRSGTWRGPSRPGTLPGTFREVVKNRSNINAEGGRFELSWRVSSRKEEKARKANGFKGFRIEEGLWTEAQKSPEKPWITPPEVKRFTSYLDADSASPLPISHVVIQPAGSPITTMYEPYPPAPLIPRDPLIHGTPTWAELGSVGVGSRTVHGQSAVQSGGYQKKNQPASSCHPAEQAAHDKLRGAFEIGYAPYPSAHTPARNHGHHRVS